MTTLPRHVGIIMDGNRRWARAHGLPAIEGHRHGYAKLKEAGDWCLDRGIPYLTVYAFSTENWKRPAQEVRALLSLLKFALTKELSIFDRKGLQLRIAGRLQEFSKDLRSVIRRAVAQTRDNSKGVLTIALNYGGQFEIVDAMKRLVKQKVNLATLQPATFRKFLYQPDIPDPELIIRTSGEQRLSGFLTWQSAYSEFFFTKQHWPGFTEKEFDRALREYTQRQRRFGK